MKIIPIEADFWKMDGGVAFGVVPKSMWLKVYPEDSDNLIDITTRCLLIQHKGRNILIDAGMGDKRGLKYYSYRYRSGESGLIRPLKNAGLSPSDITDILFTHLHDDHVGGATVSDEAGNSTELFPHAQYWVSEAQWKWSKHSNKREAAAFFSDNLDPLEQSGRLNFICSEGEWIPGIELRIFNGHTRGQLIPLIRVAGKTVVFTADFIPSRAHIPIPYVPAVDIEPLLTMKEKESFLNEAVANDYILFFEHDVHHESCRLIRDEKGIHAAGNFRLNTLLTN